MGKFYFFFLFFDRFGDIPLFCCKMMADEDLTLNEDQLLDNLEDANGESELNEVNF